VLPFEKAIEIVLTLAQHLGTERLDFGCVLNRVLAENVRSEMNIGVSKIEKGTTVANRLI
jgi:molybdopterin biosynthesis enzyme